jgi:leader peptidase (prepilin peptidase)/N-methyltransferase
MAFSPLEPLMLVPLGALGLVFGSFVTALSYRLPRGESISRGRSRCPACGHVLEVPDLVPVFSWALHGGKCRHCGTKISGRYPFIEIATMTLFVVAGVVAANPIQLLLLLAMTPVMMALAVIDIEHRRLPNGLVLILALSALVWRWYGDHALLAGLTAAVIALFAGFLLDYVHRRVTGRPGLGMGDTKLFAVAALALPVPEFLLFATLAGVAGVVFGLVWRWREKSEQFPFSPAVLSSLWLCLVAADKITHFLMNSRVS